MGNPWWRDKGGSFGRDSWENIVFKDNEEILPCRCLGVSAGSAGVKVVKAAIPMFKSL